MHMRQTGECGETSRKSGLAGRMLTKNENALHILTLRRARAALKGMRSWRDYFFCSGGNHVN